MKTNALIPRAMLRASKASTALSQVNPYMVELPKKLNVYKNTRHTIAIIAIL